MSELTKEDVIPKKHHLLNSCCTVFEAVRDDNIFVRCSDCKTHYIKEELIGGDINMDMNQYAGSSFLDSDRVEELVEAEDNVVTIEAVETQQIGEDGEEKPVVDFEEIEESLVANKTNTKRLIEFFDADSDNWLGQEVELKNVEVQFGDKVTQGVRVFEA